MTGNRISVYKGPGEVAVESVDYSKLEVPADRRTLRPPHDWAEV